MGISTEQTIWFFKQVNCKEVKRSGENAEEGSQETLCGFYLVLDLNIL